MNIGDKRNLLTLIQYEEDYISPSGHKLKRGLFSCDCGKVKILIINSVSRSKNSVVSCGCYHKQNLVKRNTTHNLSSTKSYNAWSAMKARCYNPKSSYYLDYGGRGIRVCDRWLESFENFYEDMGEPDEGTSLDRVDVNGNYEPNNCKWSNNSEQAYNTRQKSSNKSGRTGVLFCKKRGKFRAYISHNKRWVHLGWFDNYEDAVKAREIAELKYFDKNKK